MEKINIIYILGRAFTGSTILEMVLDTHPDVMSLGEMFYLPRIYRNKDKTKCSCLLSASECGFWSKVFKTYKSEIESKYPENIYELTPKKSYFKLITRRISKSFTDSEIRKYAEKNYTFFNTIRNITNKNIFVDASKNPYRLYMLQKSGMFNIKVIYLYRDGRASIDSFKKRGKKNFNIFNRIFRIVVGEFLLRKTLKQSFQRNEFFGLRYEDFTENFKNEIVHLLDFLELSTKKEIFLDKKNKDYFINRINEKKSHIVGGNIYRLKKVTEIKNFENWKASLTKTEKILFSVLGGKRTNKTMQKYIH